MAIPRKRLMTGMPYDTAGPDGRMTPLAAADAGRGTLANEGQYRYRTGD